MTKPVVYLRAECFFSIIFGAIDTGKKECLNALQWLVANGKQKEPVVKRGTLRLRPTESINYLNARQRLFHLLATSTRIRNGAVEKVTTHCLAKVILRI